MSLPGLLTESFVILPHTAVTGTGAVDRYNNPQFTYAVGATVPGRLHQQYSLEQLGGRDRVTTSYRLFLLLSADTLALTAYDRVQDSANRVFEVDGDPHVASTPRGAHHVEVNLRRVAG